MENAMTIRKPYTNMERMVTELVASLLGYNVVARNVNEKEGCW